MYICVFFFFFCLFRLVIRGIHLSFVYLFQDEQKIESKTSYPIILIAEAKSCLLQGFLPLYVSCLLNVPFVD